MGKNKRFIAKGEGQHFYLLHRSQTDEAYAQEQRPSNFVLVAAKDNGNQLRKQQRDDSERHLEFKGLRDHITPLGFKDDGYDYSQHLKEMGGGHFIGKDGKVGSVDYGKELELPADALPSGAELNRNLEAVTISHDLMDEDLRAALFDGEDDEGEFEELQDDFVLTAMTEPEEPDFDFDAHIAELIARSERETMQTNVKPRGWDNDQELLKRGVMKRRPKNDDEEYDDDDEEFDMDEFEDFDEDEDDHDGMRDHRTMRLKGQQEEDAAGDDDFDRFLEQEYDDGQLGYISDADEEELQGVIDIEGNELFNQAIEEFIQEKKDSILATGVTVTKGARALKDDVPSAEVNVKQEAEEQKLRQIEGQLVLEELAEQGPDTSIPTCQEYLREEQKRDEWDCETIISTYSTLDNNPHVIKQSSSKFKPYKRRYQRAAEKEAAISAAGSSAFLSSSDAESTSMSSYSVSGYRASMGADSQIQVAPQEDTKFSKIVLKGKLGLPEGYGPDRSRKPKSRGDNDDSSVKSGTASVSRVSTLSASGAADVTSATAGLSKLSVSGDNNVRVLRKGAVRKTTLRPVREGDEDNDDEDQGHHEEENDGQEDEEDDDEDDEDYSDDGETVMTTASMIRMRGETPEQRKARKALAKEEKRIKRTMKKQLKDAYKEEMKKQITATGKQQSINNASVFKYSI